MWVSQVIKTINGVFKATEIALQSLCSDAYQEQEVAICHCSHIIMERLAATYFLKSITERIYFEQEAE